MENENKYRKMSDTPFPALLAAGILIVELADSSQVLNTLSLLSLRLLSSDGELISGLKAVRSECQCRFAFRK